MSGAAERGRQVGFGIDIGGSGMKAAVVELESGTLRGERERIKTPHPATPAPMADIVRQLVEAQGWTEPLGVTFPGVVRSGRIETAANLDSSWLGVQADELFSAAAGVDVVVLNDADAAGLAEVEFGAAKGRAGVVVVLTFGTGIGSAMFNDGTLLPNTELGHLELDGALAEHRAAARIRKDEDLGWEEWSARVQRYLRHVELLFSPDLFVVGGGISKNPEKWRQHLDVSTEIVPAELANGAGIVGAALVAATRSARTALPQP
ncbi:MAG: ROK family protein [Acidimicrobiia bacterium]|nr:ROK family protein [Acidimicrobiia bacterium]